MSKAFVRARARTRSGALGQQQEAPLGPDEHDHALPLPRCPRRAAPGRDVLLPPLQHGPKQPDLRHEPRQAAKWFWVRSCWFLRGGERVFGAGGQVGSSKQPPICVVEVEL